ncbi:DGQHR domain-containing protein [Stenotrophomonas muris]|uniref:DGQHR domain-containing protein n=1 Tax=Stenotrophomonas muris TaxID=2963283 RepID=UPI002E783FE9|nr:DGQHR domain-containing protein [Stenotrophomonas muris]
MNAKIPLLKVRQWAKTWDKAEWTDHLPKPSDHFFIGSVSLSELRKIAGVSRRRVEERAMKDAPAGYQRGHDKERSEKISRYIQYGYPASSTRGDVPLNTPDLIHPGWLPTAILVNVLRPGDERYRAGAVKSLPAQSAIKISEAAGMHFLEFPEHVEGELEPLEIIDGQHRVYSADGLADVLSDYEVPVVFFTGLTTSWQAYLFWVINVEPKKINPSLAFDLYPELRNQAWLDRGEGLKIYQEHRAQELTEALWRHPKSPWKGRIELLGNRVEGHVSNAAFIRSLIATFIRRWGKEYRIGGLFGAVDKAGEERILRWNRSQQAAFLIQLWTDVSMAVKESIDSWAVACREGFATAADAGKERLDLDGLDPAFAGPHSLLGTDQGVRAVLHVYNAMFQVRYEELGLESWALDDVESAMSDDSVTLALESLRKQTRIIQYSSLLARQLTWTGFDWRTSSAPGLTAQQKPLQASYRGSSGYTALFGNVIAHLAGSDNRDVSGPAITVQQMTGRAQ